MGKRVWRQKVSPKQRMLQCESQAAWGALLAAVEKAAVVAAGSSGRPDTSAVC